MTRTPLRVLVLLAAALGAAGSASASAPASAPASPPTGPPGWSRPVALMTTGVDARPALVVEPDGRVHVFFLDRDGDRGVVRWIAVTPDGRFPGGRLEGTPTDLGPADLRARSLAAARSGADIVVAWIAPSGEGVRAVTARIRGGYPGAPRPIGPEAEDAGPVVIAASADNVHAVWSQTAAGGRAIWHWTPSREQGAPVAPGDAPGLSAGRGGVWAAWWQRTGFDIYRVVAARLDDPSRPAPSRPDDPAGPPVVSLTGNLATSRLDPPAVAQDAGGHVHVLFGTEQRSFGPAVARLTRVEVDRAGRASPSRRTAAGSPYASQPAAGLWNGHAVFAWTDLRSGRSRTLEIYVAVVAGEQTAEQRLTYTLASSTHPVLAAGPGTALSAAWLELAAGGRYTITIATTARPEARRFVLGIPELDLSAPGSAAAFGAVAAVGALPYALFLTLAVLFITGLAVLMGRAVLDGTRAWRWLTATPARGTLASLGAAMCLQRLAATAVLPAVVEGSGGAAAGLLVFAAAWLWVRRRTGLTPWQKMAMVLVAVFAVSALLIFPWSARTLSRLAA